jgi:tetratricopeptide (TPR) repeat protein
MKISETEMEQIDVYLKGNLSEEEVISFEKELSQNKDLREALTQHKQTILSIEYNQTSKTLVDIIEENRGSKSSKLISINRRLLAVAASLVILIGAFFLIKPFTISSGNKLFNEFYQTDPGLPTLMGSTDNPVFAEAMVDYKEGSYAAALDKFNQLAISNPKNDTLLYFQGICELELKNPEQSLHHLTQIDIKQSHWGPKSQWFTALAYLRQNNLEAARLTFNEITQNPQNSYYAPSLRVLEEMGNN